MEDIKEHVKYIADELSKGLEAQWVKDWKESHDEEDEPSAYDYLEDVLDIEYTISQDGGYRGARLLVAFGGPNIWIDTRNKTVDGYWWGDEAHASYDDELGLDEVMEELYASR